MTVGRGRRAMAPWSMAMRAALHKLRFGIDYVNMIVPDSSWCFGNRGAACSTACTSSPEPKTG
eukprot:SAG11_NODE_25123_length_363_cov_1.162879_1_plen_62_part_01